MLGLGNADEVPLATARSTPPTPAPRLSQLPSSRSQARIRSRSGRSVGESSAKAAETLDHSKRAEPSSRAMGPLGSVPRQTKASAGAAALGPPESLGGAAPHP